MGFYANTTVTKVLQVLPLNRFVSVVFNSLSAVISSRFAARNLRLADSDLRKQPVRKVCRGGENLVRADSAQLFFFAKAA